MIENVGKVPNGAKVVVNPNQHVIVPSCLAWGEITRKMDSRIARLELGRELRLFLLSTKLFEGACVGAGGRKCCMGIEHDVVDF